MTSRDQPEYTDDGHFVLIGGRRWRATDPKLPEEATDRLTGHLMAARRAVAAAKRAGDGLAEQTARARVHTAKVGLGERGAPWWEQSEAARRQRWEQCLSELDSA